MIFIKELKFSKEVISKIEIIEQMMFKREAKISITSEMSYTKSFLLCCTLTDNDNLNIKITRSLQSNIFTNKNNSLNRLALSIIQDCFDKYLSEIAKGRINEIKISKECEKESLDSIISGYTECPKQKHIDINNKNKDKAQTLDN